MTEEPIVVWGGGAIGGVVAAKLADAGKAVLLVDVVPEHVQAVRANGLEIIGPDGNSAFSRMDACLPTEIQGDYGRILLSVKGQHTEQAVTMLRPHLRSDGWVLALQNGLTESIIAKLVGAQRTMGALVNFASDYVGPGRIQFGGVGCIRVGELDGRDTARSREAESLVRLVDPESSWTARLLGYKWSKVAIGALLFTTALSNDTIVEQLGNRKYLPLWRALCQEVVRVAYASGVKPVSFDGFAPEAFSSGASVADACLQMQHIVDHCRRWVGKPRSGVWRDLAVRKRRTEVDPQITDIVTHGQVSHIQTPTVARMIAMIREMEAGTRDFGNANLDELMEGMV